MTCVTVTLTHSESIIYYCIFYFDIELGMSAVIPVAIGARFVLSLSSVGDSLKRDHLLSSSLTSFPRCAPYMGFSSLVSTDTH